MPALFTTYCVSFFAMAFSAATALVLIRTINHFDDTRK